MRLTYDERTEDFREEFRALARREPPRSRGDDERPRRARRAPEWARRFQRKMFDDGWLAPGYPPEYGGRNASLFEQMVYFQELADRHVNRSYNPQGLGIIAPSLIGFGDDRQKQRFALPILRAEIMAVARHERARRGSDLASLKTRAVLDGDHFVVNGQKVWTSGAHDADWCCASCAPIPSAEAQGHQRADHRHDDTRLDPRPFAELTGIHNTDFNEVFFDDVMVPRENLLGELNDGWRICTGPSATSGRCCG